MKNLTSKGKKILQEKAKELETKAITTYKDRMFRLIFKDKRELKCYFYENEE